MPCKKRRGETRTCTPVRQILHEHVGGMYMQAGPVAVRNFSDKRRGVLTAPSRVGAQRLCCDAPCPNNAERGDRHDQSIRRKAPPADHASGREARYRPRRRSRTPPSTVPSGREDAARDEEDDSEGNQQEDIFAKINPISALGRGLGGGLDHQASLLGVKMRSFYQNQAHYRPLLLAPKKPSRSRDTPSSRSNSPHCDGAHSSTPFLHRLVAHDIDFGGVRSRSSDLEDAPQRARSCTEWGPVPPSPFPRPPWDMGSNPRTNAEFTREGQGHSPLPPHPSAPHRYPSEDNVASTACGKPFINLFKKESLSNTTTPVGAANMQQREHEQFFMGTAIVQSDVGQDSRLAAASQSDGSGPLGAKLGDLGFPGPDSVAGLTNSRSRTRGSRTSSVCLRRDVSPPALGAARSLQFLFDTADETPAVDAPLSHPEGPMAGADSHSWQLQASNWERSTAAFFDIIDRRTLKIE